MNQKKNWLKNIKKIKKYKIKEFKKDYTKGKKFNEYLTKKENNNRIIAKEYKFLL